MVDESLWMKQSNVVDAGIKASQVLNSQYVVATPIFVSNDADGEGSGPAKMDRDRGVLLKETTV